MQKFAAFSALLILAGCSGLQNTYSRADVLDCRAGQQVMCPNTGGTRIKNRSGDLRHCYCGSVRRDFE